MTALETVRAATAALRAGQVTTVARDEIADLLEAHADALTIRSQSWELTGQDVEELAEALWRYPLAVARAVMAEVRA